MNKKIILDLCGGTGAWSKPYADAGYDVRLITLPKDDVMKYWPPNNVYGVLAAPPCTQFSFARTNAIMPRNLAEGISIVFGCMRIIWQCQRQIKKDTQKKSPLKFWALENPDGMLKWFLGKPAFEFQPWEFGDKYKKKTHLWGWFNEPIKTHTDKPDVCKFDKLKTKDIHGKYYGKYDRQTRRAITPKGFAQAFYEANR
jgi:hypothetical protein